MKLVLIHGRAGVGKDTAAEYLVREYGFRHESFARPIRRVVCTAFGVSMEHLTVPELKGVPLADWPHWSPRELMQFVGTELFRNHFGQDVWVQALAKRIGRAPECDRWVISDARFPNEVGLAALVPGASAITLRVTRAVAESTAVGIPGHASESHTMTCDHAITNDGSVADLYAALDMVCRKERLTRRSRPAAA